MQAMLGGIFADSSAHTNDSLDLNQNQNMSKSKNLPKPHGDQASKSSLPSRPHSPFFRPSTAKHATLTKVISTPKGTHLVTKKEKILRNRSGATDQLEKKSSLLGTYANLVNAIVGAGIIGIPYAMRETGLVAGLVLIFATALLTDKSLRLLISTGKHASVQSYETLLEAAFGKIGFVFISLNMLIMSYGAMIAYLLVLKDTFPIVLGIASDDEYNKRIVLLVASIAVILPLSLQRDMADLSKTSTISVVFDLCLVVIIAICSPVQDSIDSVGGIDFIWEKSLVRPSTLFVGLGVLSFAFVCQDSSFIIAGSLSRPTKERWGSVARSSLLTCASLSTIIGVTGYLGFLGKTEGNILNNFQNISPDLLAYNCIPVKKAIMVARGLLGSTMFCVYPLSSYVARHALVVLLFEGRQAHEGDDHAVLARKDRRVVLTLALYVAAIVPAILFQDLGTVLAVTGAVGGSCLSYLGPGAAFLGIHGKLFLTNVAAWNVSREEQLLMWKYPSGRRDSEEYHVPVGIIAQLFSSFLWYISLMPLWCTIASVGEKNFEVFQRVQLEKSPAVHRRLGKVIHKKATGDSAIIEKGGQASQAGVKPVAMGRSNSFDARSSYDCEQNRSGSAESSERFPLLSKPMLIPPSGSDSSMYGATSDLEDKTNHSIASTCDSTDDEVLEEDPQDEPPTTGDFLLAISYMILGAIALCAGLLSISAS